MQLPGSLKRALEQEAASTDGLDDAARELSAGYRTGHGALKQHFKSESHRIAYLVTRMPATYAAVHMSLRELRQRMPDLAVDDLLDYGAGPGTASWAAAGVFPDLRSISLYERDRAMAEIGMRLLDSAEFDAVKNGRYSIGDQAPAGGHDLVICSYVLAEAEASQAIVIAKMAWQASRKALVIVEPGTKAGFALIRLLRDELIASGAQIIAPCPHQGHCPMEGGDWCHFAARVERTSLHRRLKGGSLGYEDEKFSYLIAAREPAATAPPRILRHPELHSGFVKLELCSPSGLAGVTVARREKELYRKARKVRWGDTWG